MSAAIEAVLGRWYAALRTGDLAAFRAVAAPDIVVRWNGPPDLIPWAGEHRGVEAVLAFFGQVGAALEIVRVEPLERLISANRALLVLSGHWRVRASGQDLHLRAANLFGFRDGLVAAYEVFPDSAAFARALSPMSRAP
jgi:ketosteroid isomerase-like protein